MAVLVGLGSNVGAGPATLDAALDRLNNTASVRVLRVSSYYRSAPWGESHQPDFTNAVAELGCTVSPEGLLQILLNIETDLGRVRDGVRWGPRTLDLDLLVFDDRIIDTPRLQVPHPRMTERAFVLVPLLELEPAFRIPGAGSAQRCLDRLAGQTVKRLQ
ncbi:2-amino-4-hydroxy-6-hydroxymethyldihydropteridine diphosphokinase [Elongatibacter sediminis]|uniref:2-amino-4-hydroxy-6-hydroxymethyldihydropteridine pyrophosphokinase n=1 Tax=Elongatibacter sediminis TaxID=3119006 RepID=A0AAW9RDY4_9GAMM